MTEQTLTAKKPKRKKASSARTTATVELAKKQLQTQDIYADDRQRMIAEAAYLIAEERNFEGDLAFDDWLQAEAEIDAMIEEQQRI